MATRDMRLHPLPFAQIKAGTKTVEIRLNDEKRRLIKVGDFVRFTSREKPDDTLRAEVIGLDTFASFKDSYAAYPPQAYGAISADEYTRAYDYYSKDDEDKYGVLGILIRKIPDREMRP